MYDETSRAFFSDIRKLNPNKLNYLLKSAANLNEFSVKISQDIIDLLLKNDKVNIPQKLIPNKSKSHQKINITSKL